MPKRMSCQRFSAAGSGLSHGSNSACAAAGVPGPFAAGLSSAPSVGTIHNSTQTAGRSRMIRAFIRGLLFVGENKDQLNRLRRDLKS